MSKHTPEPWRVGRPGAVVSDTPVPGMGGSDAVEYYGGHLIGESIIEANARRIAACVNACRGLSTDELEQHGLVSAVGYELIELTKQRDELLDALSGLVDFIEIDDLNIDALALKIAKDAIAKTKGGSENHSPAAGKKVPEGWQLVPVEPTEEQWGGLARSIVFWMRSYPSGHHTPATLVDFITSLGHAVPKWMEEESELLAKSHVISKGTAATLIYKAMLAAAPKYEGGAS